MNLSAEKFTIGGRKQETVDFLNSNNSGCYAVNNQNEISFKKKIRSEINEE
jgi:hypothetical protein